MRRGGRRLRRRGVAGVVVVDMAWGRRRPQPGLALGEHSRGWRTVVVVDGGSRSGVAVVVVVVGRTN